MVVAVVVAAVASSSIAVVVGVVFCGSGSSSGTITATIDSIEVTRARRQPKCPTAWHLRREFVLFLFGSYRNAP